MITIENVCQFMECFAPLRLAEEWDNVGLLVGERSHAVKKVMTCLTLTPESCQEAIEKDADMVLAHHPMPFRPLKKITNSSTTGQMLLDLIRNEVAVYSPHTSFDSAAGGINQSIANGLGLEKVEPIDPIVDDPDSLGSGRIGTLPEPVSSEDFIKQVRNFFELKQIRFSGTQRKLPEPLERPIQKIAIACGSAGQFLSKAIRKKCDAFVLGETNFHTCLEAVANDVLLLLPGHFATERFAVEMLAQKVQSEFSSLEVWASLAESDPVQWM